MKRFSTLIFTVVFFIIGLSQYAHPSNKAQTDFEKDGLNGNIKSVTTSVFYGTAKFGKIEKKERIDYQQLIYDKYGNAIESYSHNRSSGAVNLPNKTIRIYDNKNREIEILDSISRFTNFSERNYILNTRIVYKYEDKEIKNHQVQSYNFDYDFLFELDKYGNLLEISYYNSKDSLESLFTIEHDNEGNLIECCVYDGKGDLHSKINFKYNNKNLVEISYHTDVNFYKNNNWGDIYYEYSLSNKDVSKKNIYRKDVYRYNDNQKIAEIAEYKIEYVNQQEKKTLQCLYKYNNENLVEKTQSYLVKFKKTYKYDNQNRILEEREYYPKQPSYRINKDKVNTITYIYNEKGYLLKTEEVKEYNIIVEVVNDQDYAEGKYIEDNVIRLSTKYKYDTKGNWIEQTTQGWETIYYKNGETETIPTHIKIKEREIEYK